MLARAAVLCDKLPRQLLLEFFFFFSPCTEDHSLMLGTLAIRSWDSDGQASAKQNEREISVIQ